MSKLLPLVLIFTQAPEYSRNIRLRKNTNSFEIPWPRAIKCPQNQNFMKHVLENRKKMPHPNVHPDLSQVLKVKSTEMSDLCSTISALWTRLTRNLVPKLFTQLFRLFVAFFRSSYFSSYFRLFSSYFLLLFTLTPLPK